MAKEKASKARTSGMAWLIAAAAFWVLGFALLFASPLSTPVNAQECGPYPCPPGSGCCQGQCLQMP
jgi:hypothetical protein